MLEKLLKKVLNIHSYADYSSRRNHQENINFSHTTQGKKAIENVFHH
jgi:hypothetical protein